MKIISFFQRFAPSSVLGATVAWLAIALGTVHEARPEPEAGPAVARTMLGPHRPRAIVPIGDQLLVAGRDSGTLLRVDPRAARPVVQTRRVADALGDLVALGDGRWFVASDIRNDLLLLLLAEDSGIQVVNQWSLPASPTDICADANGQRVSVSSRWAHRITLWRVVRDSGQCRLVSSGHVDLPFLPGRQLYLPDGRHLVVADASGPLLAVVDPSAARLLQVLELPGHNLHAMTVRLREEELVLAHPRLSQFLPTTRDHVFWGNVVTNLLHRIALSQLVTLRGGTVEAQRHAEVPRRRVHGRIIPLGAEKQGAGDPSDVAITARDDTIIALAGTNELVIAPAASLDFRRVSVGQRPVRLLIGKNQREVFVANELDDTISVVSLDQMAEVRRIALSPEPSVSQLNTGERLFYDARLSLDGWFSCHTCHTDGESCWLLNDNFGDNSIGAPKRIPSLAGVGQTAPYTWTGRQPTLLLQVTKSLKLTMQGSEQRRLDDAQIEQLVQFLARRPFPPSLRAARKTDDQPIVRRGQALFARADCQSCHTPPTYTSPEVYDVGLSDQLGTGQFNPPSLRGVAHRNQFFHDGRAKSLSDVFRCFGHPPGVELSADQVAELVAFLETL